MSVYTRFVHRVDIYRATLTTAPSGQSISTWALHSANVKAYFVPDKGYDGGYLRTKQTIEEETQGVLLLPANTSITHKDRVTNIRDRFGNVIDPTTFEVMELQKQPGFSGKVHHIWVSVKRVVET